MKAAKMIALFAMVLLVVSLLPAAFAQEDVSANTTTAATAISGRVKIQQRVQEVKDITLEARQKYIEAKSTLAQQRSEVLGEKEKLVELRKNNASDEDIVAQAKIVVNKAIDKGISNLNVVKNWVDKTKIDDSEKPALQAKLDEAIADLEAEKAKVDAATTKQELREIAKETRDIWKDARATVKRIVGAALSSRTESIINKVDSLSAKLDERIAKMEEQGKDTSSIEPLVADFKEKISLASAKYKEARDLYSSITTADDLNGMFKEGQKLTKEAHEYLKQAHADLVNIVKEMKSQKSDVSIDQLAEESSTETQASAEGQ